MTLAELRALLAKATPGPWHADIGKLLSHPASLHVVDPRTSDGYRRIAYLGATGSKHKEHHIADAELIVAMHAALPALIDIVEKVAKSYPASRTELGERTITTCLLCGRQRDGVDLRHELDCPLLAARKFMGEA